ncbi:MAG: Ig-like domain-containing protein [Thiohalomonadales bacterium]
MKNKLYPFLLLSFWAFFAMSAPSYAGITFNQNQVEIVLAPTCNHVPISFPYIPVGAAYDESLITVNSDSVWALPSVNTALDRIEVTFATEGLIASYTATITINDGEKIVELFINATVPPLDIYRLLDDPLRSKTYGIQRNGIYNGSIIALDPVQESIISCITVGESPTDFVINADSSELLVINSVGKTIDVIDLATFSFKETINLPVYTAWGTAGETTANIDLGPGDIIYYIDGSWGPVLHVFKRSTGAVLQSTTFNGSRGFMDFAVTSDKTRMVAMPQFGWSAGSHSPIIGHYTINGDGTVNFVKETSLSSFTREPFEAPVLMRDDDLIAVMKTISTDPANTDNLDRVFPSAIWSMNPNGSVVATGDKLYEYDTGIELYTIPGGSISGSGFTYTKAQAFTSDFTRFVYFNSSNRTLNFVNLINEIGLELLGRALNPKEGAVVNSPDTLTWAPLTGVDQYDIYLGTDFDSIAAADPTSPFYLGRVTGTNLALLQTLLNGTDYFWRIDPVTSLGPETGVVYTFTVSDIALDVSKIDAQTIIGHSDFQVDIQLVSNVPGVSWTASAADSWVTFSVSAGATPSTLSVHLDTTMLSTGFHNSSITLTSGAGLLQIPVRLEIDPLNVIHIRSDRNSENFYAISEDTSSVISQAYLLEIDSTAEKILRVIPVGSSVTDFTIHYVDNLIYVTNWKSGNLLTIDKSTFAHIKSIAFQPAGATGYSQGDVYRVAAGASERLVVEEEDQWVDIGIFNTNTETVLNRAFVREGGGAFGPTGRYYYHGENNSSGASIIKFDTSGDIFTNIAEVRPPEITSYYGSRTVVVSEDGSRIFWAGVALDQNLGTVWGIGETVYSTSTDGRYAFSESAIYDVNLRRQVLTMPTSTRVSGYNSTSKKLIAQVGGTLKFYPISAPISIPAPVLSASSTSYYSTDLSWTDKSLEMEFVVQQRALSSNTWTDIQTTTANVTSWTAVNLQDGSTYEFRVRASSPDHSSPWSNTVITTTMLQPNEKPVAGDDIITLSSLSNQRFSITGNDSDSDGSINPDSVAITTQPQFGEVIVHAGGEVTFLPSNGFVDTDSFSYTISDNDGALSIPATVTLVYIPRPILSFGNTTYESIELSWTDESLGMGFIVQQKLLGSDTWIDIQITAANVTSWTAINLQVGSTYEFRVRASSSDYSLPWSNTVTTITVLQPNEKPVAGDDIITLPSISIQRFSITENDTDSDGEINPESIAITTQPQFGEVTIHTGGEVIYLPGKDFIDTDSFSYTINDNDGASSSPATVTLTLSNTEKASDSKQTGGGGGGGGAFNILSIMLLALFLIGNRSRTFRIGYLRFIPKK